jgi:tmRNA-binding protein
MYDKARENNHMLNVMIAHIRMNIHFSPLINEELNDIQMSWLTWNDQGRGSKLLLLKDNINELIHYHKTPQTNIWK